MSRWSSIWKALISLCLQRPRNHLIGCLPFRVGNELSGGAPDMSDDPPDRCHADMVGADRATARRRGADLLAAWLHRTCPMHTRLSDDF
jgi:hypothetical protein